MTIFPLRLHILLLSLPWFVTLGVWSSLANAGSESHDIATLEHQVHTLINQHRTALGLAPFTYSDDIATVARRHSRDMARGLVGHGHEGADDRGRALRETVPHREFGENVGGNNYDAASTAQAAVTGWLNSPRHRENIEGHFDTTGIGIAHSGSTFFFTQIFLTTDGSSRSTTQPRRSRQHTAEQAHIGESDHNQSSSRRRKAYAPAYEEERDPRRRPGRKRVGGGYVQDLDESH